MPPSLLVLKEGYFERLWGGQRLHDTLGMDAPGGMPVGEAWLVADHANCESIVLDGEWAGLSLHDIVSRHPDYLFGSVAGPTVHGRFPLLLKILDAAEVLSVQVHPDDAAALALNEPDVGKTEMWHVLDSEPGSTLICGLDPELDQSTFLDAARNGRIERHMTQFPAPAGTSTFVAAGTVHAIGAGILLAEIQQNSDLTYRIYDWGRTDAQGNARELHLEKAARVTKFGSSHGGPARPLAYREAGGEVTVLGACKHFASELVQVNGVRTRSTHNRSFHILMPRDGEITLSAGDETRALHRCQAALVPAGALDYTLTGHGFVLDYYVPDPALDIVLPLREAGHDALDIARLGGDLASGDLDPTNARQNGTSDTNAFH